MSICRLRILIILAFSILSFAAEAKAPKVLSVSEADVATIRVALGYTTMLQFNSKPTSIVLGDQDAFKVEYIGTGIAIKPLLSRTATNLFVFTDYERFSFKLVTGSAVEADYLLKVSRKDEGVAVASSDASNASGSSVSHNKEILLRKRVECSGIRLTVTSASISQTAVVIRFSIERLTDVDEQELRFEPDNFDLIQAGRSITIEALHLDDLTLHNVVRGVMAVKRSGLNVSAPLVLRFSPSFLKAPDSKRLRVQFQLQATTHVKGTASKDTKKSITRK